MPYKNSYSPGVVENQTSTLDGTKEDIRLDQLLPESIVNDNDKLKKFLEAYYTFMNMDEFIFTENETFTDRVTNGSIRVRVADPKNENNKFFNDPTGTDSVLTVLNNNTNQIDTIPLSSRNVEITNGNELPGSLAGTSNQTGKTLTIKNVEVDGKSLGDRVDNNDINTPFLYEGQVATLVTPITNWVGPGPSYVMNTIEQAMDIDKNGLNYLELMQKEIAATVPRSLTVNKRNLYKQIIDFYKLRGSRDSIEIFFRLLFNDTAEVEFPYDYTLIPSSGNWDTNSSLPRGGQYLDNKGFLSDSIKLHDSHRYQKFSYLIKSGINVSDWEYAYDRLVHPSGFIYFSEILIFLELIEDAITNLLSRMPDIQPGIIGPEDIPLVIEAFASQFLPNVEAKIHRNAQISLTLNNSGTVTAVDILNPGFGYSSAPAITFNGTAVSGQTGVNPNISIGIDSNGRLDQDAITITSGGQHWASLFASVAANTNAGKVASLNMLGRGNKTYSSAPTIVLDAPTSKDADGVLLSSNVQATATFTLDSEGEISAVNITNAGNGYILDPGLRINSSSMNENRVKETPETIELQLNHAEVLPYSGKQTNPTGPGSVRARTLYNGGLLKIGVLNSGQNWTVTQQSTGNTKQLPAHEVKLRNNNFRTIINNGYKQRRGTDNFFTSSRYLDGNQTIEFLGSNTLQTLDSTSINKYNTSTFIDIE